MGRAPELAAGWTATPAVARLAVPAGHCVAGLLAAPVSAWKDPRTCVTLPFWRPLIGADPVAVIVYRHPVEVLASLRARRLPDDPHRERFTTLHGLALWERYNLDALRNAVGLRTLVVDYSAVLADPVAWAGEARTGFEGWGVGLHGARRDAVAELDAGRRHHDAGAALDDPAATPSQAALWQLLQSLPRRSDALALPGHLPEPADASRELLTAHAAQRLGHTELRRLRSSRRALLEALFRRVVPRRRPG